MFFASFLVAAYVAAVPLQCSTDGDCTGGKCLLLTIDQKIVDNEASIEVVAYRTLTGDTASNKGVCFGGTATAGNACSNETAKLIGVPTAEGDKITGNGCDDDSYCRVTVSNAGVGATTFDGKCVKLDDPSTSTDTSKCYNPVQWTAAIGSKESDMLGICKSGYTCDPPKPVETDRVNERYGVCSTAICSSTKPCASGHSCVDLQVDAANIESQSPDVKTFSYITRTATEGVCFKSLNHNAGSGSCFATAKDLAEAKTSGKTFLDGVACQDGDYCLVTIATPATGACKPLPQADAACINPVQYDNVVGPESINGFCKSPGACSINAAAVSGQDGSKSGSYGKCTTTTTTKTTPNTSAAVGSLFLSGFGVVMAMFL